MLQWPTSLHQVTMSSSPRMVRVVRHNRPPGGGDHFCSAQKKPGRRRGAVEPRIRPRLLETAQLGQIHPSPAFRFTYPSALHSGAAPTKFLKTSNEEEFEAERERLKSAMMAMVEMR